MHQDKRFGMVRNQVKEFLNGYVYSEKVATDIDKYIVKPMLGEQPGVTGALYLAKKALRDSNRQ